MWFPLDGKGEAGWSSFRLGQYERFQQPGLLGLSPIRWDLAPGDEDTWLVAWNAGG